MAEFRRYGVCKNKSGVNIVKLDRIIAVRNNKTVYHDGEFCMKVFGEGFSKADIFGEALNQSRAEESGLNVPKLRSVTVLDRRWTIVSDFIKGRTMAQMMTENPDKKDEYIDMLVGLQLKMHSVNCPRLFELKEKMHEGIRRTGLPATVRYDLHIRLDAMPKHTKLCHGDFNPSNIIVGDDEKLYIIDWAHAACGNASADAALTYLRFWLDGDITSAEKYLKVFCEKSKTDLRYLQKWLPIVAAARMAKGNEKEREFLNSWINIVDYE